MFHILLKSTSNKESIEFLNWYFNSNSFILVSDDSIDIGPTLVCNRVHLLTNLIKVNKIFIEKLGIYLEI